MKLETKKAPHRSSLISWTFIERRRSKLLLFLSVLALPLFGVEWQSRAGGDLVNLNASPVPYLSPPIYVQTPWPTFSATDPDVLEGCVTPGQHRLLRFNFIARNIGDQAVTAGSPPPPLCTSCDNGSCGKTNQTSGNFIWSDGHCHWHLNSFNKFGLYTSNEALSKPGGKGAFCLEDYWEWKGASNSFYTCENQGVSAGWEDVYDAANGLGCQYIVIDGLADGTYRLVGATNQSRIAREDRFTNNSSTTVFTLSGDAVTVIGNGQRRSLGTDGSVDLSTALNGSVSAVSWGPHQADVFWTKSTGQLGHMARATGVDTVDAQVPSLPAGTTLASVPAVASTNLGRFELVARGQDAKLWTITRDSTGWSTWTAVGSTATVAHQPVLLARDFGAGSAKVLNAFWLNSQNHLWGVQAVNGAWGSADFLDGSKTFAGPPSVVSLHPNQYDLYIRGGDGNIWHNDESNIPFSWQALGNGEATSDPVAVSPTPNSVSVFYLTASGVKYVTGTYSATTGLARTYTSPAIVGFPPGVSTITAMTALSTGQAAGQNGQGINLLYVFVRGSDNSLWEAHQGGSWVWTKLANAATVTGSPAAVSWSDNHYNVFYRNSTNKLGRATFF